MWLLNLLVVAAAIALYAGPVHSLGPLARPHLPAWLIALAFVPAELCVVHLHFRRGAHSFSLGEVPLIFGLLFCGGGGVVVGCLLGSALVLQVGRRLPPIKLVFNLGQFAVSTSVAVLVVHALAPVGQAGGAVSVGPASWGAVIAATQLSGALAVGLIACAIYLSEGHLPVRTIARMILSDGAVTLNNTCLGLCGAVVAAVDPAALPLLALPMATLFGAYRAYLSEQERQKQLDLVHEANRALTGAGEMARAIEALLERSRQTFRAESAEVFLFGNGEDRTRRTRFGPGDLRETLVEMHPGDAEAVRRLVDGSTGSRLLGADLDDPSLADRLRHHTVRQAIVAPLAGEEHLIGAILLTNRVGVGRGFDRDDLRLLDTLAGNASVALQHDRLEAAVQQLSIAHERLHHEAHHDSLTGLANRAWFGEQLRSALELDPLAVALLFIDLDNFKTVNDTLGHSAGDELLVTVAKRLSNCVRGHDLVARLGGDEFAIMVRAPGIVETAAESVAQRVVSSCRISVTREATAIDVHASVGVAVCSDAATSEEELVNAADVAMYHAKTTGKGRYVVHREAASLATR